MTDIKLATSSTTLNPDIHDLELTADGKLLLVEGAEYVGQAIKIRLQFLKGEWYLDLREGVPYLQTLFQRGASDELIRRVLQDAVAKAPGVKSIISFDLSIDRQTRELSVSFEAEYTGSQPVVFNNVVIEV